MKQTELKIVDVDVIIDLYNKKNPELKPMDRKSLAKDLGVNVQVFSDWKNGRTPKLIYRILRLKEIGECQLEDFIVEDKN
jgi:hypothetical protein